MDRSRLCNRHGYSEEKQDDWLHVDEHVGFQILTSTYGKQLEEDLHVSLMLDDVREDDESDERYQKRRAILLEKLAFLDDGSDESSELFRKHYFGKVINAEKKNQRAARMADQLLDVRKEMLLGNADQEEWTECPVDPEVADIRTKESSDELRSLSFEQLKKRAEDAGLSSEKIAMANSAEGRHAALTRLILQKQGKLGKRRRSATHGWCQSQADNTLASPNFSVFQLTIRLQRLEKFYYLNPSLVNQPRSLSEHDDQRCHVWVQSTVHALKDIDAAASSIFVKLHTTAYWIDRRLRSAVTRRCVLSADHVWYPSLEVTSKESLEVSLLRLELINADTGLVRADYALVGTLHNHMELYEFPLDADTISIELFVKRDQYEDVCLHTGDHPYEPTFDENQFREKYGMAFSEALESDRVPVVDALTASRELDKNKGASASHRLLQEKIMEPATTDDSFGVGSEFTVINGMCVFHSRGLPEVVAKYRIFTLEELDMHLTNSFDAIFAEDTEENVSSYSNPLSSAEESDDMETANSRSSSTPPPSNPVAGARATSTQSSNARHSKRAHAFTDFATRLSIRQLELLADSHGVQKKSLCVQKFHQLFCCKGYKRYLVKNLGRYAEEDKQLDADEGVTHSNDGANTTFATVFRSDCSADLAKIKLSGHTQTEG